jgi:DNA polymerase-3 subunit gamma/tau
MSYEVLARKWRPQQFDDVVGQEHVVRTLQNAITSKRVAHAYLFVGPRGVGKTSIARLFSKALNCVKGPTVVPCGECDSCREITSGTGLDVFEFDAASNTQVDKVRELIIDSVAFAPTRGRYKVYIVDEVHMLSGSSFNALLKTLEEPPSHVIFMFATTESEKVPATIVSRCQRFDLKRIPVRQIVERLRQIAVAEKISVEDNALLAIARGAEGGLRDAESALDQLIAFKGASIEEGDVLSVFGLVARSTLETLAERVLTGDVKGILEQVRALDESGKDFQRVVAELLEHFRNLLVVLCAGAEAAGPDLTDTQREVLGRQAKLTEDGKVLRLVDILTETSDRMRYSLSKRTLLETALIRCCRAGTVVTLEEVLVRIESLRDGGAGSSDAADDSGGSGSRAAVANAAAQGVPAPGRAGSRGGSEPAGPVRKAANPSGDELGMLRSDWTGIVGRIARISVMAQAPLRDALPVAVAGDTVTIAFDPEFETEIDDFKVLRNRSAVEHVLSEVLKRQVRAEFSVMSDAMRVDLSHSPAREDSAAQAGAAGGQEAKQKEGAHGTPGWSKEPVRKVMDLFGGRIVETRE